MMKEAVLLYPYKLELGMIWALPAHLAAYT